jgi:hypothetical protein
MRSNWFSQGRRARRDARRIRAALALFLSCALLAVACGDDDGGSAPPPNATPAPLRSVPLDVRDTSQPFQRTIYNTAPGGGSVGMPVRFGDFDGDGHGDFVACPMLADSGLQRQRRDSGEIHIYFGTGEISGVVADPPDGEITTLMGARRGDLFGNESHIDDLDGDGRADLISGAQNYDGPDDDRDNAGAVFVYYGRAARPRRLDLLDLPDAAAGIVLIVGAHPGDRLGIWVDSGDVDGDGARDLILGADQADGPGGARPDCGAVYVLFGGQAWPALIDLAAPGALRTAVIHGVDPSDHFGSTILSRDVDGDGRDDLIVAAGLARGSSQIDGTFLAGGDGPDNDRRDAGEVQVLFSASPFPAEQDLASAPAGERAVFYGAAESDVAGEELAAGDVDGDGSLDIAIGSLQASGPGGPLSDRGAATGRTYVVFDAAARRGTAVDLAAPAAGVTTIFGRRRGSISGDTLIVADMDGDGIDDLWDASPSLGTRDLDGVFRIASGVLDVLFGQPQWPPQLDLLLPPDSLRIASIRGADANDQFAYGLGIGDANADGRLDLIINGMAGDGPMNDILDAGELYVIDNRALFDTSATARAPLYLHLDIQPIFAAACQPCHSGDEPAAGLALDSIQNAIAGLLGEDESGAPSTQVDRPLVHPGAPQDSYLLEKLTADAASPAAVGDPMPPPPAAPLPARVIDDVRRWIASGAPAANEDLPPPPPPPAPPVDGFSATFFARLHFVLADPALGDIEVTLLDPPAAFPLRIVGPQLVIPASEFTTVSIVGGDFGDIQVELRADALGTIDRDSGAIELDIELIQLALGGTVETRLPATLTTGSAAGGPFQSTGEPLDPIGGTLRLVGVGTIPEDTAIVGGDAVLIELEGSVVPLVPAAPALHDEIQHIFTNSCALANCHIGDGAAGLNLEPGRTYDELVGVASAQVDADLVRPGSPELSYLLEKVAAEEPTVGLRMPVGGALAEFEIEAIRQWIAGGAAP